MKTFISRLAPLLLLLWLLPACAEKDMVDAGMTARFFDRRDIFGIFDHADQPLIAARIRADVAKFLIREVMAGAAKDHALAKLSDELPEREGLFFFRFEQVKDHALGRAPANAGKFGEGLDQFRH